MDDILLGAAIMAAIGWGLFRGTMVASDRLSSRHQHLVAGGILLGMAVYGMWLWNNTAMANWFPFSNLIIVANWFPLFLLALGGVIIDMREIWCWRRWGLIACVVSFAGFTLCYPLLGSAPKCGEQWNRAGDCMQTTRYTCSAASAATLLKAYGIEATEQEMAELCLTREGTSWMGLYRGLTLKTTGTVWKVEVVECSPTELFQLANRPMIIDVGLPSNANPHSILTRENGWTPGVSHSVVLWGPQPNQRMLISDPMPTIGREEWHPSMLQLLYRGRALRIVERFPLPEHLQQLAAK
jgi:Peptidase C39 family